MTARTTASRWRALCAVLAALCLIQLWRDARSAPGEPCASAAPRALASPPPREPTAPAPREPPAPPPAPPTGPADDGVALYGFAVPRWVAWLAPHPGEDLRSYRDRMLPLALAVIAPQRARVARSRDSFLALAGLDARQRAELDAATGDAAAALQDRVMSAVVSGELSPASFKPTTAIAIARDLLDIVGAGDRRFVDALRGDQRAQLAHHPFDFADYLVFSTHWEDALQQL